MMGCVLAVFLTASPGVRLSTADSPPGATLLALEGSGEPTAPLEPPHRRSALKYLLQGLAAPAGGLLLGVGLGFVGYQLDTAAGRGGEVGGWPITTATAIAGALIGSTLSIYLVERIWEWAHREHPPAVTVGVGADSRGAPALSLRGTF
jgi:hypothetical protein